MWDYIQWISLFRLATIIICKYNKTLFSSSLSKHLIDVFFYYLTFIIFSFLTKDNFVNITYKKYEILCNFIILLKV